jgi:hypothetical protein
MNQNALFFPQAFELCCALIRKKRGLIVEIESDANFEACSEMLQLASHDTFRFTFHVSMMMGDSLVMK